MLQIPQQIKQLVSLLIIRVEVCTINRYTVVVLPGCGSQWGPQPWVSGR